jgi:hypothetical protein
MSEHIERIAPLLGPIAGRMTKASNLRDGHPFELALAVMEAAQAIEAFGRTHRFPFPPEPVAELLEKHLKNFLAPDWKWRRQDDEEKGTATGQEKLEATILQFRRSA